jgi:TPR repeat protein
MEKLEKQCHARDAAACHLAGTRYRLGVGVAKDADKGEKLLQRALDLDEASCQKGDPISCFVAAEIHRTPGQADQRRAVPLYEKACAGGLHAACTELERLADK